MFSHYKHIRSRSVGLIDDDPSSNSPASPGSPSSFSKPGSNAPRHRTSSSGGGSTPTSTGGASPSAAASSGGGYAARHSLTQVAAGTAGAEGASKGSSGGRSLTSSRRASVTERPSHRRSPSHGMVDSTSMSSPSSAEKPRGLYSKMLSYGRRSATAAAASPSSLHHQQQQISQSGSTQQSPRGVKLPALAVPAAAAVPASPASPKQQQQDMLANLSSLAAGLGAAAPARMLEAPAAAQLMQLDATSRAGSEPVPDLVLAGGNSWYGSTAASCRASQLNITATAAPVPAISKDAAAAGPPQDEAAAAAADAQEAAALAAAELAAALVAPPASGQAGAASSGTNPLLVTLEALGGIPGLPTSSSHTGDGSSASSAAAAASGDASRAAGGGESLLALGGSSQRCSLGGSASSKALSSEAAARAVAAIFGAGGGSSSSDAAAAEPQGGRSTGGGSWLSEEEHAAAAAAAGVPGEVRPAALAMHVSVPAHGASSGGGSWLSEDGERPAGEDITQEAAAVAELAGDADCSIECNTGEEASSAKSDSKPSTPTEKARAIARAAFEALSPQLRKSREWRSGRYAAPSGNSGSSPDGTSSSSKKKGWRAGEKKAEKKAAPFEKAQEEEAVVSSSAEGPTAAADASGAAVSCAVEGAEAAAMAAPDASAAAGQEEPLDGTIAAAPKAAAEEPAAAGQPEPAASPRRPTPRSARPQASDAAEQGHAHKPEPLHVSLEAIASSAKIHAAAAAPPAAAGALAALPDSCAGVAEEVSTYRYEQEADEAAARILEQAARSRPCSLVGARASFNNRRTSSTGLAAGKEGPLGHLASSSCDSGSIDAEYAMASAEAAIAAAAAVAALPISSRSRLASFGVSQDALISSVASPGSSSIAAASSSSASGAAAAAGSSSSSGMSGGASAGRISAGGRSGSGSGSSGDYRYSELIFRLQQFLPALKAADGCGPAADFESTWELIKSELLALVGSAKLASLQAGRLEVLDAEVAQLQTVLVRVGQHIKCSAQQQQLRDLVCSFPSFARRQILDSTSSSDGIIEPASPSTATAAAAAAASPKPGQLGTLSSPQPSASPKAAPWSSPHNNTQQPLKNTGLFSNHSRTSPAAARSRPSGGAAIAAAVLSAAAEVAVGSSGSGVEGGRVSRGGSPIPPSKALTAEEAEKLASLYKVVDGKPQRIFYKTLKLAAHKQGSSSGGGSSGTRYDGSDSPSASPRSRSMSPAPDSPAAAAAAGSGGSVWTQSAFAAAAAAAGEARGVPSPVRASAARLSSSVAAAEGMLHQQQQQQRSPQARHSGTSYSTFSAVTTSLDPSYYGVLCSTGHVYMGSAAAAAAAAANSSAAAVRSSWSSGVVTKGFRALRTIPEAHRRPFTAPTTGPGSSSSSSIREDGQVSRQRLHSGGGSNIQLRESYDGQLASESYTYPHSGSSRYRSTTSTSPQRRSPNRSPERAALLQSRRRCASPPRQLLLQSQQHSPQQQQQQQQQEQQQGLWSYPRGRDRRIRASGEGSLGYGSTRSKSPNSALLQSSPVMQPRARSTSPSLGMHYLEKAPGNSSSNKGKAGSTRSSVCSGSIAALRGMGGSLACGVGGSSISSSVGAAAGLAEDARFSAACKAFLDVHSTAVAAEGLSPTKASIDDGMGGARLAARLSPLKDADSSQIDEAMGRLASALQENGVNLKLSRSGPALYSAAGRKLRLRMLNGNLLVRTGGGHQDLLDALGKLPLSAADGGRIASAGSGGSSASSSRPSSGSSRASGSGRGEAAGEAGLVEAVEAEPDAEVNAEDEEEDEFCCYTTLTLEAAAAAGCADSDQQQQQQQQQQEDAAQLEEQQEEQGGDAADDAEQQAITNAEDADHNNDGVVAVVKIGGEGSAVALQCLAELGSTGGAGDAAWMAMVAEAAASASKLTGYTSEQVLVAAASELAGQ